VIRNIVGKQSAVRFTYGIVSQVSQW